MRSGRAPGSSLFLRHDCSKQWQLNIFLTLLWYLIKNLFVNFKLASLSEKFPRSVYKKKHISMILKAIKTNLIYAGTLLKFAPTQINVAQLRAESEKALSYEAKIIYSTPFPECIVPYGISIIRHATIIKDKTPRNATDNCVKRLRTIPLYRMGKLSTKHLSRVKKKADAEDNP